MQKPKKGETPLVSVEWEMIPQEMKGCHQWVIWRKVERDSKWTKVPYCPNNPNRHASVTDPKTWGSFEDAWEAYQNGRSDGIGFVFTQDDGYAGIDLDHCRNSETGELQEWAHEIIRALSSFTEISPSKTGVHILVKAKLPSGGSRKQGIEMYDSGRFFCVTGHHLAGTPRIIENRQNEVEKLHSQTFLFNENLGRKDGRKFKPRKTMLTDEEVIKKASEAKNQATFQALWQGQWAAVGYPSQSEADLALCGLLAFWTGHNAEQIDRLFRQSKLFRAKWDKQHYSNGNTYGQEVIQKVLDNLQEVYQRSDGPKERANGANPPDLADGYLRARELQSSEGLWLRWYREEWWKFDGKIYKSVPLYDLRADVMTFLQGEPVRSKATKTLVGNVLANLEAQCLLPHDVVWPAQFENGTWSSHSDALVFANGILNIGPVLEGKKLPAVCPHTPNFVSRVALPFAFDPAAQWPKWQAFLEQVLPDPESRQLLRELFGYCLTFDTSLQKFFLFEGTGANGKGVVLGILANMLGEDNVSSLPLELFGAPHGLETTLGKLVNITAEIGDLDRVAEGLLKQFTGNDLMHFNPKFRQAFTARPTAKLIMATNIRPPFRDRSDGLWRRLIILPFPVTIPADQRNPRLIESLTEEMPGILNWAISGAQSLRKRGRFQEPAISVAAKNEFKREANPAREYLLEHYREDPNESVKTGAMYEDYKMKCKESGVHPLSNTNFGREVKACFPHVERVRLTVEGTGSRPWAYQGITLADGSPCPVS